MNPPSHLRFVVGCITVLGLVCAVAGTCLLVKGYQSGELFVGIVGTVAGGLVGMISMRGPHGTGSTAETGDAISSKQITANIQTP